MKILVLFVVLLSGCIMTTNGYIQEESDRIYTNTDNILTALNYSNYEIIVLPITNYGREIVEYSTNDTEYLGSGLTPEGPPGEEGETPPQYKELNTGSSSYYNSSSTYKYSENSNSSFYIDYFSVLVVIENGDKSKLESIIRESTLNHKRGDIVSVLLK